MLDLEIFAAEKFLRSAKTLNFKKKALRRIALAKRMGELDVESTTEEVEEARNALQKSMPKTSTPSRASVSVIS